MIDCAALNQDKRVTRLIVNADDFGYFECVSRGILQGAKSGSITATGIMANCPDFQERVSWLSSVEHVDAGVHLNVTYGYPLSKTMASKLSFNQGKFVGKFEVVKALLKGTLEVPSILEEWRWQIDKCQASGIQLYFLNSHEHLHMLPPLFEGTHRLAEEFAIPFVRFSSTEWKGRLTFAGLVRNVLMESMNIVNKTKNDVSTPHKMVGLNESGCLNLHYLERIVPAMDSEHIYELMCHPGFFDAKEITDQKLLQYHRWEEELDALLSSEFASLCAKYRVQLAGYRNLV